MADTVCYVARIEDDKDKAEGTTKYCRLSMLTYFRMLLLTTGSRVSMKDMRLKKYISVARSRSGRVCTKLSKSLEQNSLASTKCSDTCASLLRYNLTCFRISSEAASWQVEVQTTSNAMREVCESLEYPQGEQR